MKTKRSQLAKMTAVLISLGALLSGCASFFPVEEGELAPPLVQPKAVTYTTMEVEKGSITTKISGTGVFYSVSQHDLSFEYRGGYLKDIYVQPGDFVTAGQLLAELDTESIKASIAKQELYVQKLRLLYDHARSSVGSREIDWETARLDYEMALLDLQNLQNELTKAHIYSPIDGSVIYMNTEKRGDYVNARSTVTRIADLNSLQLAYRSDSLSDFVLGLELEVTIDNEIYKGTVVMTPSTMPVDASADLKRTVLMEIEDLPDSVELGQNAKFELITNHKEDIIVVPKNLVTRDSGDHFVYLLEDGVRVERQIEIGISNSTHYEVLDGLEVGELLIMK